MIQAVEAGKGVPLENPFTATIQAVDAMIDALQRTGWFCQVGFQSQLAPSVRGLKQGIAAGRLGSIQAVVVPTEK